MAVDQNKSDGPGFFAWFRRNDKAKNANNNTRDLFMNTILKLFDVESEQSLPQAVSIQMEGRRRYSLAVNMVAQPRRTSSSCRARKGR